MAVDFPFKTGQIDFRDPTIQRTSWDTVSLGPYTLPGISTISPSRGRKLQVKTAKDQSYGTVKDTGLELARLTITNVIIGQSQLEALEPIIKFFDTQLGLKVTGQDKVGKGETVEGFAVDNPLLQMRGINAVYIESIDGPFTSAPGFITTVFKCIEIRGDKPTSTKSVSTGNYSFVQNTAFNSQLEQPTPPSQIKGATAPKSSK